MIPRQMVLQADVFVLWDPRVGQRVLARSRTQRVVPCSLDPMLASSAYFFVTPHSRDDFDRAFGTLDEGRRDHLWSTLETNEFIVEIGDGWSPRPAWDDPASVDCTTIWTAGWHGDAAEHGEAILGRLDQEPPHFKSHDDDAVRLPLPVPNAPAMPLSTALSLRRTHREYGVSAPSASTLSTLLCNAAGVQGTLDIEPFAPAYLRPYPSGGARHPLEIYAAVRRAGRDLSPGRYHWCPHSNVLTRIAPPISAEREREIMRDQEYLLDAPVWLLLSAVTARRAFKYERAVLYNILLEAGALLQNLGLVATSIGLAGCPFEVHRHPMTDLFALDHLREPLLIGLAIGCPTDPIHVKGHRVTYPRGR